MSSEFIVRLFGMIVFSIGGLRLGIALAELADNPGVSLWAFAMALVGALFGIILTPYLTTRPVRVVRTYLTNLPAQQLFAGIIGLIVGLIIAALISLPLSLLPEPWNSVTPIVSALVLGYFGTTVFAMRRREVFEIVGGRFSPVGSAVGIGTGEGSSTTKTLLDTSVIIDGRIADISSTGFVMGPMLVPRFVLNELQHIADSSDPLRRQRGRRGMDILNDLQENSLVPVQIIDMDVEGIDEVDEKLVILAKQLNCNILTNDYNLNSIAKIQGVTVLNINELANAVKTILLPGEALEVEIIQEGREIGQGVGYLEDGTMVVVTDGRQHINERITTKVTRVLQTAAGRMIFAEPA